jgi:carbon-monoxide dehydrogenase medium subunit
MRRFELLEPASFQDATRILAQEREKCLIIAGGTDLLLRLKKREISPDILVSLRKVPGISFFGEEDHSLKLGAFTTHRAIEKSQRIKTAFPALSDAVGNLGSIQIRNVATVGGNICNAAPSADTVPPLMVHDAKLKILGAGGEKELPLADFIKGPGKTELKKGEFLTEIIIPEPPPLTSSAYIKLTRRSSMELPLLGVAAQLTFSPERKILNGRIAISCAGPFCFRPRAAEALLSGREIDVTLLEEIGAEALKESKPRDSFRCSAKYREAMIPILVARSITRSYERCFRKEEKP